MRLYIQANVRCYDITFSGRLSQLLGFDCAGRHWQEIDLILSSYLLVLEHDSEAYILVSSQYQHVL